MTTATPGRPGRPSATPPAAQRPGQAQSTRRQPQDLDALRNLPAFVDEGPDAETDPANASSGRMVNETATITSARFFVQDWKRKDGTYPESAVPEVQLRVLFKRDGSDAGESPYRVDYKYGSIAMFAPTKDGLRVKPRPDRIKEGYVPLPRKTDPVMLLLASIQNAGGKNIIDRMKTEGAAALENLRVHVRMQKTSSQSDLAKALLLVDYIDGVAAPVAPTASAQTPVNAQTPSQAQKQQPATAAGTDVSALAEAALIDVLEAKGGSVARGDIATTLIRIAKWKEHEHRSAILKLLREDSFIVRDGSPWKVDGNTISL